VDPEAALRRTARRFRARYAAARAAVEADGLDPASLDVERWLAYWDAAKRSLAAAPEGARAEAEETAEEIEAGPEA